MNNNRNKVDIFDKELQEVYEKSLKTDSLLQENKEINAEIQNKKLKIQKQRIDKLTSIQEVVQSEDIINRGFNADEMLKNIEDRKNAIVFLNKSVSQHIIIAPGSLVAIPSMTNNGKSTLLAHLAEAIVASENKPVIVISNEESEPDVRARVSCIRTGVSFGDYKTNRCSQEEYDNVISDAQAISHKLIVISSKNEADAYRATTVSGVISTIKSVINKASCVIIDYYNNVNISELGTVEPWHVNNQLASELNILKNSCSFPLIVAAQCQGIKSDKKMENKGSLDFDANHPMYRWKGGQNLLIYATDIIELVKDFDNSCSFLFCHKVRFSHGDLERLHMLPFDKKMQKFVEWTPEFDIQQTISKVTRDSRRQVTEIGLDKIFSTDEDDN